MHTRLTGVPRVALPEKKKSGAAFEAARQQKIWNRYTPMRLAKLVCFCPPRNLVSEIKAKERFLLSATRVEPLWISHRIEDVFVPLFETHFLFISLPSSFFSSQLRDRWKFEANASRREAVSRSRFLIFPIGHDISPYVLPYLFSNEFFNELFRNFVNFRYQTRRFQLK